jgi:hypothetical protein
MEPSALANGRWIQDPGVAQSRHDMVMDIFLATIE